MGFLCTANSAAVHGSELHRWRFAFSVFGHILNPPMRRNYLCRLPSFSVPCEWVCFQGLSRDRHMPHAMWVDCVWRWRLNRHSEKGALAALAPGGITVGQVWPGKSRSLYPRLLSLLIDLYTVSPLWAEDEIMVGGVSGLQPHQVPGVRPKNESSFTRYPQCTAGSCHRDS